MKTKKIALSSILAVMTMSCASGLSEKDKMVFSGMRKQQISLAGQVSFLKQRILILEGLKGNNRISVKSKKDIKSTVVTSVGDPNELPTVKLRPSVNASQKARIVTKRAPVAYRGKRVVLKLRGVPAYNQTIKEPPATYGKRLRLGKFYPLKEPDGSKTVTEKSASKGGVQAKYKFALSNYSKGRYALALTLFSRLNKIYPHSKYIDNVLFWQGECWYKMGKYKLAIKLYNQVINKYGSKNKAPDAMFKMAFSYYKLGYKDKGRALLAKVMEIWPNSKVASKASLKLEKMRR
jgi:tol-pal system protein YbgF